MSESSSNANLDYNANTINLAIGWVSGVRPYVSAEEMIQAVTDFQGVKASQVEINTNINGLATAINNHTQAISDLNTSVENLDKTSKEADSALSGRIDDLATLISGLDVSVLEGRVSANENNITTIDQLLDGTVERVGALENTSLNYGSRISTAEGNITTLTSQVNANSKNININLNSINSLSNQVVKLASDVARHEGDFASVREFGTILTDEIEKRASDDAKLSERITNEMIRAGNAEEELLDKINAEIERSTEEDGKTTQNLANEISRATQAEQDLKDAIQQETQDRIDLANTLNEKINSTIESEQKRSDQALAEAIKNEASRSDLLLTQTIEEEKTKIAKALDDAIEAEVERSNALLKESIQAEQERSDEVLNEAVAKINDTVSDVSEIASSALSGVNAINDSYNYIRNDYNEVAIKPYVFRIVFLDSEQDYINLETKEQGTLYLIREED